MRNPVYGSVKTRLAATVGDDLALKVYRFLIDHTVKVVNAVGAFRAVYYSDSINEQDVWTNAGRKVMQHGKNLGERMSRAFKDALSEEFDRAVIIGTDCYELTAEIIEDAFTYLERHDVVLGPALDGGYYLLGMNKHHPELFEDISWSTDSVLEQTLTRCKAFSLSYVLLPRLSDIDEEKDLVNTDILNKL